MSGYLEIKTALGVRPRPLRGDYAGPPDAAESPAPATAMICFDDDNNSLNAAMSEDGREDIFWSHKGDVVAIRDMCLQLSNDCRSLTSTGATRESLS
jgi:hypothetical protein